MSDSLHLQSAKRRTKRPSIQKYAKSRDEKTWNWIEERVLPHLQSLIDRAQLKLTRHAICYSDGMGMSNFYIDPPGPGCRSDIRLDHAIQSAASSRTTSHAPVGGRRVRDRDSRYVQRFPELVEFAEIVNDLDEYLGQSIGEMHPTPQPEPNS